MQPSAASTRGGRVDPWEEHALHAAEQQANLGAAVPLRGGPGRRLFQPAGHVGRQRLHGPQPCGQPSDDPGAVEQAAQPQPLVQREPRHEQAQPLRVGKEAEHELPEQVVLGRALVAALDLLACGLDQLVILHAGGARRHAGHAAEALIEVARHRVVQGLAL